YNRSSFDGQNGSSNLTDIDAIAPDKQPLLPVPMRAERVELCLRRRRYRMVGQGFLACPNRGSPRQVRIAAARWSFHPSTESVPVHFRFRSFLSKSVPRNFTEF